MHEPVMGGEVATTTKKQKEDPAWRTQVDWQELDEFDYLMDEYEGKHSTQQAFCTRGKLSPS